MQGQTAARVSYWSILESEHCFQFIYRLNHFSDGDCQRLMLQSKSEKKDKVKDTKKDKKRGRDAEETVKIVETVAKKSKKESKKEAKTEAKKEAKKVTPKVEEKKKKEKKSKDAKTKEDQGEKKSKKSSKESKSKETVIETVEETKGGKKEKKKKDKKKEKMEKKKEKDTTEEPHTEQGEPAVVEDGNEMDGYYDEDGNQEEGTTPGSAAKAFQRVNANEWLGKKGSWDNSYEGTFGAAGWGFKAQQILGKVRGKDFRHEKTKKKRGSYRGGAIDPSAICSYKFDSDDD